jgi:dual specificity protein phosphatase-like protein
MTMPSLAANAAEPMPRHVDVSWLLPNLALGGRFATEAIAHLVHGLGICSIVDLRSEDKDDEHLLRQHAVELLHLPTLDGSAVGTDMLHRGVAWVNQRLDRGGKVFVHCEHGIGRSALLACCVLVSRGRTPRVAIERVKAARARVAPSPEQLRALLEWTSDWCQRQRRPCPPDTLAELTAVAYRHLNRRPAAVADPRRWFTF